MQWSAYNFQFACNGNYVSMLCRYQDIVSYLFNIPHLYIPPPAFGRWSRSNVAKTFGIGIEKLEFLSYYVTFFCVIFRISDKPFCQFQCVMEGHTSCNKL